MKIKERVVANVETETETETRILFVRGGEKKGLNEVARRFKGEKFETFISNFHSWKGQKQICNIQIFVFREVSKDNF